MGAFVGIDLGTTNSAVACRDEFGRPAIIPSRDGQNVTPSMIYFGCEPPAVGHEAKEWARLGNEQIASFFKPHMGNPHYKLHFNGKDYDATALSTMVLKKLKDDAEAKLDEPVSHAVITVPAYFADAQRKATIDAGRRAGLQVLRIINEPTAAALAYGLKKEGADETVLIYDLGGGTFDVTVARITADEIAVLSTAGDHDLGGKNWDDRVATFFAEKFAAETGVDPLDDPVALNELLDRAERAKWTLSERSSARLTLQLGAERRSYELTRAEFETMTFPLMERTRALTEEALVEAKLAWPKLTGVLLVGGSTRMPMVRQFVGEMSGKPPARESTSTRSSLWARRFKRRSKSARRPRTPCLNSPSAECARSPTSCRTAWARSPSTMIRRLISMISSFVEISASRSNVPNPIVTRPTAARTTRWRFT